MGMAAIFSGQGAQHVGMGRACLGRSSELADCFARAGEVFGMDLRKLCLDGPGEELTRTDVCQVALYTVGYGTFLTLKNRGFWKNLRVCFGQSLGEWTALAAAGAISFEGGLRTVAVRARLMHAACGEVDGTMAALIGGDREKIEKLCASVGVVISNYNGPDQLIISGPVAAVAAAGARGGECGVRRVVPLRVAGAYHSPLMEPARRKFEKFVEALPISPPACPVLSNVTGQPFANDPDEMRRLLVRQLTEPVQWERCVATAAELGTKKFYECGAGRALAGLVGKILPGTVAVDANGEDFWQPFDSAAH